MEADLDQLQESLEEATTSLEEAEKSKTQVSQMSHVQTVNLNMRWTQMVPSLNACQCCVDLQRVVEIQAMEFGVVSHCITTVYQNVGLCFKLDEEAL